MYYRNALNERSTCVVASVHPAVMVAHSVEVIQVDVRKDGLSRRDWLFAGGLLPRLLPASRVHILHALTPLHHMGRHVQSSHWETHQRGQLVPPLANLFFFFTCRSYILHTHKYYTRTRIKWTTQLVKSNHLEIVWLRQKKEKLNKEITSWNYQTGLFSKDNGEVIKLEEDWKMTLSQERACTLLKVL